MISQDEQLNKLVSDVGKITSDVADLRKAVIGDETFGQEGLVHRVKDLETWKAKVTIRMATVAGGVLALWKAFAFFFTKKG